MTNDIENLILNKLNSIESNVVSIKEDVQELKVWSKGIDEWKDEMTVWSKGIDEWKDEMTVWSKGIDEWKDGMTTWAKGMDDWKDGINQWQESVEEKLDRLMPLCDWSTRFEAEVYEKLKILVDAYTVREQKLQEHSRLLEKHQKILDFHSLKLA